MNWWPGSLLDALWAPQLFWIHRSGLAFVEIIALWIGLAVALISFWRARKAAGILPAPCLAWESFAAMLNFTIWQ